MWIAKNDNLIIMAKPSREELEKALSLMVYTSIEETETEYQFYNGEYLTPEEVQEKERQWVSNLRLTRGDVFRGLLLALGVTRTEIRGILEAMSEATPEEHKNKELALIDFDEALDFYRGVPLIDQVGSVLGISPSRLDNFFKTNDWHALLPSETAEV